MPSNVGRNFTSVFLVHISNVGNSYRCTIAASIAERRRSCDDGQNPNCTYTSR